MRSHTSRLQPGTLVALLVLVLPASALAQRSGRSGHSRWAQSRRSEAPRLAPAHVRPGVADIGPRMAPGPGVAQRERGRVVTRPGWRSEAVPGRSESGGGWQPARPIRIERRGQPIYTVPAPDGRAWERGRERERGSGGVAGGPPFGVTHTGRDGHTMIVHVADAGGARWEHERGRASAPRLPVRLPVRYRPRWRPVWWGITGYCSALALDGWGYAGWSFGLAIGPCGYPYGGYYPYRPYPPVLAPVAVYPADRCARVAVRSTRGYDYVVDMDLPYHGAYTLEGTRRAIERELQEGSLVVLRGRDQVKLELAPGFVSDVLVEPCR